MGVFYETIPQSMRQWILDQKVFWVASAPLSNTGHVNMSPKGGPYFGVLDERTFWYMDLSGSGNETISHLLEPRNGRITIMFNAFEGGPRILRLWGHGRVLEYGTDEYSTFIESNKVQTLPGTRSIIMVDIHQVGSSCGFSVPFYDFKEFRPVLNNFFEKKHQKFEAGDTKESMDRYWAYKNAWSMDGLPGMQRGLLAAKQEKVVPIKKMVGPLAPKRYQGTQGIAIEHAFLIAFVSFLLGLTVAMYGPRLLEAGPTLDVSILRNIMERLSS
ncbi:hypothetical protein LTR10_006858 [Elasticomyces elasticus]|nr:hypothetical protein LTR10_006858 [Elasticomyces elasticus]KAK4972740.1 hypothetical protein LTR42_006034 [Elasticomyces elasticus]